MKKLLLCLLLFVANVCAQENLSLFDIHPDVLNKNILDYLLSEKPFSRYHKKFEKLDYQEVHTNECILNHMQIPTQQHITYLKFEPPTVLGLSDNKALIGFAMSTYIKVFKSGDPKNNVYYKKISLPSECVGILLCSKSNRGVFCMAQQDRYELMLANFDTQKELSLMNFKKYPNDNLTAPKLLLHTSEQKIYIKIPESAERYIDISNEDPWARLLAKQRFMHQPRFWEQQKPKTLRNLFHRLRICADPATLREQQEKRVLPQNLVGLYLRLTGTDTQQ
ncbi:MAG: hypothetical protein AB7R69_02335 [Candidatus Babeliales bacterium]